MKHDHLAETVADGERELQELEASHDKERERWVRWEREGGVEERENEETVRIALKRKRMKSE